MKISRVLGACLCVSLLMSLISSCGYSEGSGNENVNMLPFEKFGVTMEIPDTWEVEINDENFVGFSEYDSDGEISTMCGLSCTSVEDYGSLSEYLKEYEDNLNLYDYIEQISISEIDVDDTESYMITYTNNSISKNAKCKSIILLNKRDIIELIFYSENENAQQLFDSIINSMDVE